ncbi:MAG: TonB-dependent receptor, partial [Xanthomonadales bacterium]|nr:TonB-dependent receptor [Xanthomonadales bacterium]NIX11651.1 TonB-dependent receptor [Xanthomonadales bacterium]
EAAPFTPFPLFHEQSAAGLAFDLAGSDTRKLQLELSEPLTLGLATQSRWLNLGGGEVAVGTSLDWLINDQVSLQAGLQRNEVKIPFQTVGSIHCQNGVLEAGSYRASDCYFVNESNDLDIGSLSLGANLEMGHNASAAINVFRRESSLETQGIRRRGNLGGATVLDAGLLTPVLTNPLLPAMTPGQPLDYLDSEVTGIDLELQVGVSTNRAGDMRLGLQLTRILDGVYEGYYSNNAGLQNWNVAEPVDSARMSFDWSKGAFSGGIQSFYREPVEFMNNDSLDAVTTFDVHFTWRTPWNASLSVGATNLLNSGMDEDGKKENTLVDPFESVYGRIPYVRYQQDL